MISEVIVLGRFGSIVTARVGVEGREEKAERAPGAPGPL